MKHAGNCTVINRLIQVDGIGVIALYHREDAREALHRILQIVGPGSGCAHGGAVKTSHQS